MFLDIRRMRSLKRTKKENFTENVEAHIKQPITSRSGAALVKSMMSWYVNTMGFGLVARAWIMNMLRLYLKTRPVAPERDARPKSKK